jgi:cell wall-associated NlpC family hydrolase
LKPFKIYAASAALSALMFASLSASASPDAPAKKPAAKDSKDSKTSSQQSDWDKYRMSANRASVGEDLAHKALSYRGVRYRFGGTTTNGIDCSGLTQTIYSKWGKLLPRTAVEQFQKGRPVPKDQLKAGDLVFFKNTYRAGISHVGIFVGDGKFVHAANANKGVIMSPLSNPYYNNHYAGARRIALDTKPDLVAAEITTE